MQFIRNATVIAILLSTSVVSESLTRPRIVSDEGVMHLKAPKEFIFTFKKGDGTDNDAWDDDSAIRLSAWHQESSELNAAVKRNQASNAASIARLTSGLDVLTKGRLPKIEADLAGLVSEHCLLSDWGQWSKCSKSCGGGTTERSRAVIKQAINSIPCSSFRLKEMQACNSLPCTVDLCNGNERWYNLNSGDLEVIVSSHYTKGTQDILHFVMGATTGSGPSGPTDVMVVKADAVAGEHTIYASNTLRSAQTGLPPRTQGKFASGDYICGTLGGIEVLGSAADPLGDANRHRSWVPARLRGRKFVVPVTRGNPQVLMILAIESDTTVMLKVAGQPRTIYALRGQVRVVQTNAATRSIDLEANKDILVTYVGGTVPGYNEAGVLTSNPIGNGDYFAIPPATDSDTLYGVAGSSAFVAVATAKICLLSATSDNGDVIKQTLSPGQNLMLPDSLGLGFDAIDFDGPVITANCTEVIAGSTGIVGVVTFDTVSGDVEGAAVAWLPRSVMRTFFLFPFDAHRVTFVCLGPGMAIFFKSGGLAVGAKPIDSQEGLAAQLILTLELDAPLMTKETLVKTTSPCYAIAASTSRPRGEITLYGA